MTTLTYSASSNSRQFMFRRMMKTVSKTRFPRFLATQFMSADTYVQLNQEDVTQIRLGNMREWIAWALFSKPSWNDLQTAEPDGRILAEEAEGLIRAMLTGKGVVLEEGCNEKLKAIT